jgi:hypothetical protein
MLCGIGGFGSAQASAQSGIAGAVARSAAAAGEVARASGGPIATDSGDSFTLSGAARAQFAQAQQQSDSIEHGLIEQDQAKHELTANVRVMQTADDMLASLMSIGGR